MESVRGLRLGCVICLLGVGLVHPVGLMIDRRPSDTIALQVPGRALSPPTESEAPQIFHGDCDDVQD